MTAQHTTLDIGVDLDGCCYDFVGALRRYIAAVTGRAPRTMPEPTCWDFYATDWGLTLAEFLAFFHAGVAAGFIFADGAPYPGVVAGTRALVAAGHRVHLLTDRASAGPRGVAEELTRGWLARYGVAHTTLVLTADKTSVPTDVFLEDKAENYRALRAAGTDAFLRHHAYNADVDTPVGRRVPGFTGFVDGVTATLRAA